MNTKHTPAPWFVSKSPAQRSNKGKIHGRVFKSVKNTVGLGGKIIANAFGGNGIVTQQCIEEAEANAKRIVTCVNSMEGLTNKQVENIRSLNAELLEALEKIADGTEPCTEREAFIFIDIAKSIATEAIKKATE
jgi:orotidine-5'-phosphate decarboxylase